MRITGENEVGKLAKTLAQQGDHDAAAIVAAANLREAKAAEAAKAAAGEAAKAAEAARVAAEAAAKTASAPVDTGFGDVGSLASPSIQPTQSLQTGTDTGFDVSGAGDAPVTTMNTVSDTGAPEDADADLDARIAALLPK
jgi:membrane protein involved in colicin uptake